MGGTNVQLVMLAKKCSMQEAYRFIAGLDPTLVPDEAEKTSRTSGTNTVRTVRNIQSDYLLNYFESRKIPEDLARKYCREIIMRNQQRHQTFTLIGFENNAGGYALKSPSGYKSSTTAGITTINDKGVRTDIPSSSSVLVFEGFFDFLSWQVLQSSLCPSCDVVVLNSVSNLNRASDYLRLHDKIVCFLDNDTAGKKAFSSIKMMLPDKQIADMSHLYQKHKDLSEMLQESRGFSSKLSLKL
ncbi:MAG: toprim domain-containing protein [Bacteroidales bacterium]|nr:toprim domain-containing protein [Bacteroidales bacterium]